MAQNYVFSSLSQNQLYTNWTVGANGVPVEDGQVFISGGAGVINKDKFITPRGVVTSVTDEQLAILEKNEDFRLHKRTGFIEVRARSADADKIGDSLNAGDKSRQATDKTLEVASTVNNPYIEL
jgi:hypothetical protein